MTIQGTCAGVALSLLVATASLAQPPSATEQVPASVYQHPGRLVAVEGQRRLNLVCMGEGAPTVMLEAGLGDSSLTWASVQAGIARVTRVCAYDRAGYGFSDPAARASDATNAAADLQRLLKAARIRTPIVLVAHSLGGLYATLFTSLHRDAVSGLVLVDPSFADQNREIFQLSSPDQRAASEARLRGFMTRYEACLALARRGRLTATTRQPANCLLKVPDPALNAIVQRQYMRPKTQAANLSEIRSISSFEDDKVSADSAVIDAAPAPFGHLPMIVLTRGNPTAPPPFLDAETQVRIDAAWLAGHERLAARSSIGQSRVVPGADHYIQRDQPAAVVQAVLEVVRAANSPGSAPGSGSALDRR